MASNTKAILHLVNPKPRTDWRIDEDCFYYAPEPSRSKIYVGKVSAIGLDGVTLRLLRLGQTVIVDHVPFEALFVNEDDAKRALVNGSFGPAVYVGNPAGSSGDPDDGSDAG